MRDFLNSVELTDLIQGVDRGRETTVEAEDGIVHDGRQRKVVKKLGEVDPDVRVTVLAKALVVEAVHLGDLAHLVISTENGQSILETHLQGDEESNSLY